MAHTTTRVPGTSNAHVAGLFADQARAEAAIEELRTDGFSDREIGVATSHDEAQVGGFWDKLEGRFGKREHTAQASDLEESLRDSGIPEQKARYFNSKIGDGGVLVTVNADPGRANRALSILRHNRADVGTAAAEWNTSPREHDGVSAGRRIQLLGEILRVHKERVSRGEVRLRKEVVTEKQNIEVPTTREELVMERVPAQGREAAGAEVGSGEKEIRVPLTEERVHVEKKPVVNEEVIVGKRQVQDTKRVSDDVRHEELRSDTKGDIDQDEVRSKTRKSA